MNAGESLVLRCVVRLNLAFAAVFRLALHSVTGGVLRDTVGRTGGIARCNTVTRILWIGRTYRNEQWV